MVNKKWNFDKNDFYEAHTEYYFSTAVSFFFVYPVWNSNLVMIMNDGQKNVPDLIGEWEGATQTGQEWKI